MVRTGTIVRPGSDAAVFRVREANKILAATTDCNSLYCRLDPREGGAHRGRGSGAQSHLLRRKAARGDRQSEFRQSLQTGESSGNCAKRSKAWRKPAAHSARQSSAAMSLLYNESPAGVVDPTPTVAMVGLIDDEAAVTTQFFKDDGRRHHPARRFRRRDGRLAFPEGLSRPQRRLCRHGSSIERELAVQNAVRELIRTRAGQKCARLQRRRARGRARGMLFQSRSAC